jgi:hypothetical protein
MQKININERALEILVPSKVLKFNRYKFIPHAIETGGAY